MRGLLVLLGAVAMLAAGCGGGGSSSGTTTSITRPPLSKGAYQAKLEAISKEVGKQIGETGRSGKLTKSEVDRLVKGMHQLSDRLAEVSPPAEVKGLHARLIGAIDELADDFPDIADKLNKSGKDASNAFEAFLGAKPVQELIKLGQEFKAKGYNLKLND